MTSFSENFASLWTESSVRLIATPSKTARSAFFYVQEVGHFQTLPGYFTEREHLNSYLVVYTAAGSGTLKYRNRTYTLGPGQLFFIDCMEHHYYTTDRHNLWEMVWVHFYGGTSRGYYEQFAKSSNPILTLDAASPIPDTLGQLIRLHQQKDFGTELLGSRLLVSLLTELLLTASQPQADTDILPHFIAPIVDFLDKHYTEKIRLEQLAEQFALNKFHLAKTFKKYMGETPNEYVINLRINKAKEWLKYSNVPVEEIAANIGIENVSHFINLFKSRVETTPLAFRKKWHSLN